MVGTKWWRVASAGMAMAALAFLWVPGASADQFMVGSTEPATARTMKIGEQFIGTTKNTFNGATNSNPDHYELYRLPPVFAGDVLTFIVSSYRDHTVCLAPEVIAKQPCGTSNPGVLVFQHEGARSVELTARTTTDRLYLRIQSWTPGDTYTLTLKSVFRPLTLEPFYLPLDARTDTITVIARGAYSKYAPEGLPCHVVVVGPGPNDVFWYDAKVRNGKVVFSVDLARLNGQTVGYIASCDGSSVTTGSSFVVVK